MAILEVEHINKTFGRTEVLKDISFSLERGQVLSLSVPREVERRHFCAA